MLAALALVLCLVAFGVLGVLCVLLVSPAACVVLAAALALTPAACAWCFHWLDRREAKARQAHGPLSVTDEGNP